MARKYSGSIGLVLLLLSFLLFWATVWRIPLLKTPFLDLAPTPDAPEYLAGALSLHRHQGFRLHFAGESFPPRYPFGYSLLMLPFLALEVDPVRVPFLVNHLAGAALLLLLFGMLWVDGRRIEAGLAALLMVTFPSFLILSRSPMSEVGACLFVLCGYYGLYRYVRGESLGWGLLGASILGLSLCIRVAGLLLATIVLLAPASRKRRAGESQAWPWIALPSSFLAGALPLLIYNWVTFGNVLKTGYGFWVPGAARLGNIFNLENGLRNLNYWSSELIQHETQSGIAGLFGRGSYFGPVFIVLILISGVLLLRNRLLRPFAASGLIFLLMTCLYFYHDARLLFPLFVLCVPVVAVGATRILTGNAPSVFRLAILVLLLCHVAIYPGTGRDPDIGKYVKTGRLKARAPDFELVGRMNEVRDARPALVLTTLDPVYAWIFLKQPVEVAPLERRHEYRFNPRVFRFGGKEARELAKQAARRGTEIYTLVRQSSTSGSHETCPGWKGFRCEVLFRNEDGDGIARLLPARP